MSTDHREIDMDAQLRAFAAALEAHTAEPIRPGPRSMTNGDRDPVLVEPIPMPARPDRHRWLLPTVAAAVVVLALVAGLAVLSDDTTPSDTPTSTTTPPTTTTPEDDTGQPSSADAAVVNAFFTAYNSGDTDNVLSLLAGDVVITEQYGGLAPNPNDDPLPSPDQQLAWKHAQGEILTQPTCIVAPNQPFEGSSVLCEYTTLDTFVQAVDGTPIPTRALITIVDGEITELHQGYGNPDYSVLASQFRRWIEQNHPDLFDALFEDWTTRAEAVEQGRLRAEWAQEWARSLAEPDGEQAAPAPQPAVLAPPLEAPVDAATQRSIVGDITWTRLDGDPAAQPERVLFEFEDLLYGRTGPDGWWSSPDGITWTPTDLDSIGLDRLAGPYQVGSAVWAELRPTVLFRPPPPGPDRSLHRFDGTSFVSIELPAHQAAQSDGLVVASSSTQVVAEFAGSWLVQRDTTLAVPWADLLDLLPNTGVRLDDYSWDPNTQTFGLQKVLCVDTGACGDVGIPTVVRADLVDGTPARIDFYANESGDLITSIELADDGRTAETALSDLAESNYGGTRHEYFLLSDDGTDVERFDWPFGAAPFSSTDSAVLGGRLFVLNQSPDADAELWATSDHQSWEQLSLPEGTNGRDSVLQLESDGERMILTSDQNPPHDSPPRTWVTADGQGWTAATSTPLWVTPWSMGPRATELGWYQYGEDGVPADPVDGDPESPAIAVSPDGLTWQIIPIPFSNEGIDVSIHTDTIFITLDNGEGLREMWVGHVGDP